MNPIVKNGNRLRWKFDNVKNLTEDGMFSDKITIGPVDWQVHIQTDASTIHAKQLHIYLHYKSNNEQDKNWICQIDGQFKLLKQGGDGKHLVRKLNDCFFHDNLFWGFKFLPMSDLFLKSNEYFKDNLIIIEIDFNFKYFDFSKIVPNFTDITIQIEDTDYHLNKWALGSKSQYFYDLFLNSKPNENESIKLNDVEPQHFCYMLASFYPFFDTDLVEHYEDLMKLAKRFSVPPLHYKCQQFMLQSSQIPIIDKIKYAEENDYEELMKKCIDSLKNGLDVKKLHANPKFSDFKKTTKLRIMERCLDFF